MKYLNHQQAIFSIVAIFIILNFFIIKTSGYEIISLALFCFFMLVLFWIILFFEKMSSDLIKSLFKQQKYIRQLEYERRKKRIHKRFRANTK